MKQTKRNTLTLPAALLFILAALLMALDAGAPPQENPPAVHSSILASVSGGAYIPGEDFPAS